MRTLGDLIRAGKILDFGLSNFHGWRIAEVVRLCGQAGVPAPIVCSPYYNILKRGPEVEILPACAYHGIGVVPYSPIARGVLAGVSTGPGDTQFTRTPQRPICRPARNCPCRGCRC